MVLALTLTVLAQELMILPQVLTLLALKLVVLTLSKKLAEGDFFRIFFDFCQTLSASLQMKCHFFLLKC